MKNNLRRLTVILRMLSDMEILSASIDCYSSVKLYTNYSAEKAKELHKKKFKSEITPSSGFISFNRPNVEIILW